MIYPYQVALSEYGTKGTPGASHNPAVLKYFDDIGSAWVDDDETPWCAAFVNWCLKTAGHKYSAALNARSFLTYGKETKTPVLGDLVILWRINKVGPFGHVGFYIKETKNLVYILSGNQSNQVNITAYDKVQLLGYRSVVT